MARPDDGKFEDVFDDDAPPADPKTVHRIRANSSIMQLKKILGAWWKPP
jgi:hypothetical protein